MRCAAAKTESVFVDEYSIQLTVRALLGEEMHTQDKKISDVEKQMEKQRGEAKAETEKLGYLDFFCSYSYLGQFLCFFNKIFLR
jgi:hypothetical protein